MNRCIFPLFIGIFITLLSCQSSPPRLNIAYASNVQYAMDEIISEFETETKILCNKISSSSGKITAQIHQGADYDLFLSADIQYPNSVYQNNQADQAPIIYASGNLAIWSTKPITSSISDLLTSDKIKHIAIANPDIAPYGKAAYEYLNKLGIYDAIKSKLVYGENIAQTNQYIASGSAQIGFTSFSMEKYVTDNKLGEITALPQDSYSPIRQAMISIKSNRNNKVEKDKFIQFMQSATAQNILTNYNYSLDFE